MVLLLIIQSLLILQCLCTIWSNIVTIILLARKAYGGFPVVNLSVEDNARLSKQLEKGFKRSAYWNKCKVIDNKKVEIANANAQEPIGELLDLSYQGVKRLFVLSYDDTEGDNKVSDDSIKQYDEIRIVAIGQGDDCATGCLLDFACFKDNCRLITADLIKQKALDADSRAIQQIIFTGKIKASGANTRAIIYYIFEQ